MYDDFDKFVDEHKDPIRKAIWRIRKLSFACKTPASDIWAHALVGLYEASRRYSPERGEFNAFAYKWILGTIKRSLCEQDGLRTLGKSRCITRDFRALDELAIAEFENKARETRESYIVDDKVAIVREKMKLLTPKQREALERLVQGEPAHVQAKADGLSKWTVGLRLKRATRDLSAWLST